MGHLAQACLPRCPHVVRRRCQQRAQKLRQVRQRRQSPLRGRERRRPLQRRQRFQYGGAERWRSAPAGSLCISAITHTANEYIR